MGKPGKEELEELHTQLILYMVDENEKLLILTSN